MDCIQLWAIVPELILMSAGILLVPLAGIVRGRWRILPAVFALLGFLAALGFTARMLPWQPVAVFCDTYAVDGLATVLKLLLEAGAIITLLVVIAYFRDHYTVAHAPLAILFSTLGAIGLVSSLDLTLIILTLQMVSLPAYLLVGLLRRERRANEATLKYFIYAAVALAVMAYGLTFLYGLTGKVNLADIGQGLAAAQAGGATMWIAFAAALILIGYAFEATVVPFHFWAPDVYEGATAPVAGFVSVVPKIASFGALIRFALLALPGGRAGWPLALAILAAVTMTLGNVAALRQTRLKRLLAYSSIAQAGYVLMAVAVAGTVPNASSAASYYLAVYLFMNLGAFAVVAQLERAWGTDQIAALRGLGRRAPGPALVLTLSLLSLAGIPPLAGFAGKVLVLEVALDGGLAWLAVIAAINWIVALYYYVGLVAQIYFRPATRDAELPGRAGYRLAWVVSLAGTLVLGIVPALPLALTDLASLLAP
jgi:NADH-quinone oxidoreductase subunit N